MGLLTHIFWPTNPGADNPIYRLESGRGRSGRLRWGSPTALAHAAMIVVLSALTALVACERWREAAVGSAATLIAACLIAYDLAIYRAFDSVWRERIKHTLEHVCLVPGPPIVWFGGKFYGCLAPYVVVQRYLVAVCAILCVSCVMLAGKIALALPAPAMCIAMMVQVRHSAWMGTLIGFKHGCQSLTRINIFKAGLEYSPLATHLVLLVWSAAIWLGIAFICSPIAFVIGASIFNTILFSLLPLAALYMPAAVLKESEAEKLRETVRDLGQPIKFEKDEK
jgi:hypothetical protein